MAKILVLGGAGMEGAAAAKWFAQEQDISEIILADRRIGKAEQIASEIGKKASAREVNVNDHDGMVKLMKEVDIVTNFVGPFYIHLPKVLRAVIESKVKYYADIGDDGEPVEEAFQKLDGLAKENEATILLGMGDGPGLSNLCCAYGASKLDRVDKLHVYWGGSYIAAGGGVGAGLHAWHCFRDKVPQFLDGKLVHVPPRSGAEWVEFNNGAAQAYFCAQSEQYTMPKYFPSVKEVFNKEFYLPTELMEDVLKLGELGFAGEVPIMVKGDSYVTPVDLTMRLHSNYWFSEERGNSGKPWFSWKNEAIGEKYGKTVGFAYGPPKDYKGESMEIFTSVCAVVGMLMMIRGETTIKEKGIFAPEGLIEPKEYLLRVIKQSGSPIFETETVDGKSETHELK